MRNHVLFPGLLWGTIVVLQEITSPKVDFMTNIRGTRHLRSFHSDVSYQAQGQNLESTHRSFDASAPVSTFSPTPGFAGFDDLPPMCLP